MSRANVEHSLDAVEQALTHFAASLERAGFGAGADAYRQMAHVVVGQWLWVENANERDIEPRYLRIAELAETVAAQLTPYVEAMQQLRSIRGLVEERWGVDPDSTSGRIVAALTSSRRPMSLTQSTSVTREPFAEVKRALLDLTDRGLVRKTVIGSRVKFTLESQT